MRAFGPLDIATEFLSTVLCATLGPDLCRGLTAFSGIN